MCRFRASNHRSLPMNTGRYNNISYENRYCNLSNQSEIGDEFQYLFKCYHFTNERYLYTKSYFRWRPNVVKNVWSVELYKTEDSFSTLPVSLK